MTAAFFSGAAPPPSLPGWVEVPGLDALALRPWTLLALTAEGCRALREAGIRVRCGTLLLPEDQGNVMLGLISAERVAAVGPDCRSTLTFSSLQNGMVVCVQRTLLRPDGGSVEPQELPLPPQTDPPEVTLLVWGLRLLGEKQERPS